MSRPVEIKLTEADRRFILALIAVALTAISQAFGWQDLANFFAAGALSAFGYYFGSVYGAKKPQRCPICQGYGALTSQGSLVRCHGCDGSGWVTT